MTLSEATLLVVDDEPGLLRIFKRWFEREGSRVLIAENGLEALEIFYAARVDMIITDVHMPQMGGIEFARRVKGLNRYLPKLIFISGFSEIDQRECCGLGIEYKLAKPIRREHLLSTVQTCLTGRDELWRSPPDFVAGKSLTLVFESVEEATLRGLLAFGSGGFCVHSGMSVRVGERIELNVEFTADGRSLTGQGVVRWAIRDAYQIGVEIVYIDDANRAWMVELTEKTDAISFIPETSGIVDLDLRS